MLMKKIKTKKEKKKTDTAEEGVEGKKASRENGLTPIPRTDEYDQDTSDEEVRSCPLSSVKLGC